jgi:virulence-associated protein VapD
MYAISFDLDLSAVRKYFKLPANDVPLDNPYADAYAALEYELRNVGFRHEHENLFLALGNLANVYKAIAKLSSIEWFKKCAYDVRAFRVEDWSDFTEIIRNS